jgi:S-DNA-T family DNA segregation ATPase FtsK/SpoIIIE
MDNRYQLLKDAAVRNIQEYNEKFIQRRLNPNKGHNFMPYIVLVIDEFADLIMTAGKEVELPIARLAQLARAVGIHLIVATQRPSTNIITGVIKANFPSRIAFRVASMIDSRTILDSPGANQLIGRGDMLISRGSDLIRVQCAFIDTPELNKIVEHIATQQSYYSAFELPEPKLDDEDISLDNVDLKKRDKLFEDAARLIVATQQGSTSLIQRKLAIGYNRAGRIMDQLEAAGIVGPAQGSKPRDVYLMDEVSLHHLIKQLNEL